MCPLTEGTKNAEFTGHRDFGQNTQDKEGGNKANSMAAATLLCMWLVSCTPGVITYLGTTVLLSLRQRKRKNLKMAFFFFPKLFSIIFRQQSTDWSVLFIIYRSVLFISTGLELAQLLTFIFLLMC